MHLSYCSHTKDDMMSACQPRADVEDDDRDYADMYPGRKIEEIASVNAIDN